MELSQCLDGLSFYDMYAQDCTWKSWDELHEVEKTHIKALLTTSKRDHGEVVHRAEMLTPNCSLFNELFKFWLFLYINDEAYTIPESQGHINKYNDSTIIGPSEKRPTDIE
jgi:hypothetical protein